MATFKRIFLFMAVNILVVLTLSFVLNLLGIQPYLQANGLDYGSLAAFCLVWGMGGAFISLQMSRWMAKRLMGVQVIDPQTHDSNLQTLVQTVHNLARSAGLPKMPEVGIYESPDPNAFATGPSKSRSLVAVSTGLFQRMNQTELEGVLGHEVAHIANGDMVTMTLLQGIVNAFVMFLARAIAFVIAQSARGRDSEGNSSGMSHGVFMITTFVLELIFMVLGSLVVARFSRYREFRADKGGARLAGSDRMIAALRGLQRTYGLLEESQAKPAFQSMQISGKKAGGFLALFSSHPPLEERIARLERSY